MTPKEITKLINRKIDGRKISINLPNHNIKNLKIGVVYHNIDPSISISELRKKTNDFVQTEQQSLTRKIDKLLTVEKDKINEKISKLPIEQQTEVSGKFSFHINNGTFGKKITTQNVISGIHNFFNKINGKIDDYIETSKLESLVVGKYSDTDYIDSFQEARKLKRKFIFHAGPTNSGKTYHALKVLKEADTGCYLAPLRLLAHEVYEDLNSEGYPTDLITGEERIEVPDMKYSSSTIEMIDFAKNVDVAVIDEIQMISDPFRGWAWTQAVVGIPASTVILAGSPDAIPVIKKLVERVLGEELEIIEYERKTKLIVEDSPTNVCNPGDCVVVFSRKRIFEIKDQLSGQCSIIYGSLGPDVRKSEAKKFREGDTNIVTSTDAIGMGLNLPIKRIVFADIVKFNGIDFDVCDNALIRQISGRAGRYGKFEEGYVTATTNNALSIIKDAINEKPQPLHVNRFQISPNQSAIKQIGDESGSNDLIKVLRILSASMKHNKIFEMMNLENMMEVTRNVYTNLSLSDKFIYSCAPINTKVQNELQNISRWTEKHFKGVTVSFSDIKFYDAPAYDDSFILRNYEDRVKLMTVYCWLSFRFPSIYIDRDKVVKEINKYNRYIMDMLNKISKKKKKKKMYIH